MGKSYTEEITFNITEDKRLWHSQGSASMYAAHMTELPMCDGEGDNGE